MKTVSNFFLNRREAVSKLLEKRNAALVVTGLGSSSYDVHKTSDNPANYYLWGAMGGAALVGLGLAQAQPDKRVMVITGDGEQLMAFGSLATIAVANPSNLDIIIIDNQHYGETGMQLSHTSKCIDFASIAQACGFADTEIVRSMEDVNALCIRLQKASTGPRLYVIKVTAENLERSLPPRDATFIKNRFRGHLGLSPC